MLIDSHVNLHSDKYTDDLGAVIDAAREAGVVGMLTISDKIASTDAITEIAKDRPFIWRSVGAHPHYASEHLSLTLQTLVDLAAAPDVVGVGECGLDFYYEHSPRDAQERVFRAHIEAAQETALPLIIHTRDADDAMLEMLHAAYTEKPFTPLLHCYTSGQRLADAVLEMGGFISYSGIITFKNADDVRAVAKRTPIDRVIIETDCPYLAPVPMRGRRNEPAFVVHVAEKLAEIFEVGPDEIARATTDNFFKLFARADRSAVS